LHKLLAGLSVFVVIFLYVAIIVTIISCTSNHIEQSLCIACRR